MKRLLITLGVVAPCAACHFLAGDSLPCDSVDQCPPAHACVLQTCVAHAPDDAGERGEGEGE